MSYKVSVVTGTRADYGLLKELLFRLKNNIEVSLEIIVTGSHLCEKFGNTYTEILRDGFCDIVRIPIPIEDDTKGAIANAIGVAICKFSKHFETERPDILVALGDRYEIISAVLASVMNDVPVAHISGGDITEGVIDDIIRNAITKMSTIHFPGCEQSRKRIIQMGEQPDMVFNVGEPGVENCLSEELLTREELAASIDFSGIMGDYAVVTFHPVTLDNENGKSQVRELIKAMDKLSSLNFIVTMANADAGGRAINDIWIKESQSHKNWHVAPSLGVKRYLSAMKYSKAVIGNSSSGIVEAPILGVPTVNIGDRQKGRMMADSIINCESNCKSIVNAIKLACSKKHTQIAQRAESPFGNGNTSALIERYLIEYLKTEKKTLKKSFFDISFVYPAMEDIE